MAIFEPTNLRNDNYPVGLQSGITNRYRKTDSGTRGFQNNGSLRTVDTPGLLPPPEVDRIQIRRRNSSSRGNKNQPGVFVSPRRNVLSKTSENNTRLNVNSGFQRPAVLSTTPPAGPLTGSNLFRNAPAQGNPNGLNSGILTSTQTLRALEEYQNFTSPAVNNTDILRRGIDTFQRTRGLAGYNTLTTGLTTTQNQFALTTPPTLSLIRSRGIDQYTTIAGLSNGSEQITGNTADLYLKSNPTERLATQLLP